MNTQDSGRIGEIAVAKQYTMNGYYVFFDQSGKCPVDLIVWKDGITSTIQVKTTSYRVGNSWLVQLKSVRPNRTKNTIKHFDNTAVDYLAIYIIPEDRVIILQASEVTQTSQMRIKTNK